MRTEDTILKKIEILQVMKSNLTQRQQIEEDECRMWLDINKKSNLSSISANIARREKEVEEIKAQLDTVNTRIYELEWVLEAK